MEKREAPPSLYKVFQGLWDQEKAKFPREGSIDYPLRLAQIEGYLRTHVHPNVEKMAILHGAGFLTNHGPEHIRDVIRQAGDLAAAIRCDLTGYEAYLLIVAAHFHDVGNMFGRTEHERRIWTIMESLGDKAGEDRPEKRMIESIARAHGGYKDVALNDRDTLSSLPEHDQILRSEIRPQLLAALLRFGDELAEDDTRANTEIYDLIDYADGRLQKVSDVPEKSRAYHAYAHCLNSCVVHPREHEIVAKYALLSEDAKSTFTKGESQVYLLDEIQHRIQKLRTEMIYFTRHSRGQYPLGRLSAQIEIFESKNSLGPIDQLRYVFAEKGYPEDTPPSDLAKVLRKVEEHGRQLNGRALARELRKRKTSKRIRR